MTTDADRILLVHELREEHERVMAHLSTLGDTVLSRAARMIEESITRTITITTVEELDALPVASHVRLAHGLYATKYPAGWWIPGDDGFRDAEYVADGDLPITVLYQPEEAL